MTPEVTQETGRRRTTSEGQYQSGTDSPDFAHNLALNPGGRPREVRSGSKVAVSPLFAVSF